MKDTDFIEISAYLRILEKRLLSGSSLGRILEAPTAMETLRQLSQNSVYDFSAAKRPEDYEAILRVGLKQAYDEMRRLCSHSTVIDIVSAKYVFHNIKTAVKIKYTKKDMRGIYSDIPLISTADIEAYVFERKGMSTPEYIKNAVDCAESVFAESNDPQDIDIELDKSMFQYILKLCDEIGSPFITEYTKLSIDFQNVKTLMRVKNMKKGTRFLSKNLIPNGLTETDFFIRHYEKGPDSMAGAFYYKYFGDLMALGMEGYAKTENYGILEKLLDDRLIEHTKKAKYVAYGPEVLFAYLLSRENEVRQIRILMSCKQNGVQAEALKERLRDNYA